MIFANHSEILISGSMISLNFQDGSFLSGFSSVATIENSTFTKNGGGFLFNVSESQISLYRSLFIENSCPLVISHNWNAIVRRVHLLKNCVSFPVFAINLSNLTISGSEFHRNSCGQILQLVRAVGAIQATTFSRNIAPSSVLTINQSKLCVDDTEFANNTVPHGSVVLLVSSDIQIANASFVGSRSRLCGASLSALWSQIVIHRSVWNRSISLAEGAAICFVNCSFDISDCLFWGNEGKTIMSVYSEGSIGSIRNAMFSGEFDREVSAVDSCSNCSSPVFSETPPKSGIIHAVPVHFLWLFLCVLIVVVMGRILFAIKPLVWRTPCSHRVDKIS
jgi:hypothetical protein